MYEELNKKLAEWLEEDKDVFLFWRNESTLEVHPHLRPNFPESLDACFKWLVPKVVNFKSLGHPFTVKIVSGWGEIHGEYGAEITNPTCWKEGHHTPRYALEFNKNPALALCLAIEKLIDKEEPNEGNQNPNATA